MCEICNPKKKYTDCICGDKFTSIKNNNLEIETKKYENFDILKELTISTITVCCDFCSKIDINKFKNFYSQNISKAFYNSINVYITVKYQDRIKISVKIFSNGKIQMAGLTNSVSTCYAIRKIFKRIDKLNCFEDENKKIKNLRICMINSDFKINKNIKQKKLCEIFDSDISEEYDISRYTFNPSKYPAINLKIKGDEDSRCITCAIFRPGSIIITGGEDFLKYKKIYLNILNVLNNNNLIY